MVFDFYKRLRTVGRICFLAVLSELHDYSTLKNELFSGLGGRYYVRKPFENIDLLYNHFQVFI
jgi:hypothetical protein